MFVFVIMFVIVFGMCGLNYNPFFALIVVIIVVMLAVLVALVALVVLIVRRVTGFIHNVQRVHVRKHGNRGPNNHVFHCRNGHNEIVRCVVM